MSLSVVGRREREADAAGSGGGAAPDRARRRPLVPVGDRLCGRLRDRPRRRPADGRPGRRHDEEMSTAPPPNRGP